MDYNHIKDYLEKFRKIIFKNEDIYLIACSVISRNINKDIFPKQIQIKKAIIFVSVSPLIRNELFMKKDKILKEIREIIPDVNIVDLR